MSCPPGYRRRKSYTRKVSNSIAKEGFTVRRKGQIYTAHPNTSPVYVPSTCVKIPVSTKKAKFGKLRKGHLLKYGYQYRLSDRVRRKALEKAIEAYGLTSVYHKLDAVAKLSVHSAPDASKTFAKDREWVHRKMLSA